MISCWINPSLRPSIHIDHGHQCEVGGPRRGFGFRDWIKCLNWTYHPGMANEGFRDPSLANVDPIVSGVVALFYPHVEVVLHNVHANRIERLWNAYSGREVGGESLLDAESLLGAETGRVMGPFEQVAIDGRKIASVSVPLNDGQYLLCMNFDRAVISDAIEMLERFAVALKPQPAALFKLDWQNAMHTVIDEWCAEHQRNRSGLTRADRLDVVSRLDQHGLFATKNAAEHAGQALGVSRSSAYALLSEARAAAASHASL